MQGGWRAWRRVGFSTGDPLGGRDGFPGSWEEGGFDEAADDGFRRLRPEPRRQRAGHGVERLATIALRGADQQICPGRLVVLANVAHREPRDAVAKTHHRRTALLRPPQ